MMLSLSISTQTTQGYLRMGNVKLPLIALHEYYGQLQPFALNCNQSKPALKEIFLLARHGGETEKSLEALCCHVPPCLSPAAVLLWTQWL